MWSKIHILIYLILTTLLNQYHHYLQLQKRVLTHSNFIRSHSWLSALFKLHKILYKSRSHIHSVSLWSFSSVQFSHSFVSDSLQPNELQHTRFLCPSPNSRVYSNLCPLSQWWHPTISSSVTLLSYCLHSPSIRVLSNESAFCIRWPKHWNLILQHQSFQWIFRVDFL